MELDVEDRTNAAVAVHDPIVSPLDAPIPSNPKGPMVVGTEKFVTNSRIDELEREMVRYPLIDCPLTHTFTPGMYGRQIFMPAGSIVTSKIHRTEHQYVVLSGRCAVWIEGEGWKEVVGPCSGITKPGTRRVLVMFEDTVWMTFHPTEHTDLDMIESDIIQEHKDHLGVIDRAVEEGMKMLKEGVE